MVRDKPLIQISGLAQSDEQVFASLPLGYELRVLVGQLHKGLAFLQLGTLEIWQYRPGDYSNLTIFLEVLRGDGDLAFTRPTTGTGEVRILGFQVVGRAVEFQVLVQFTAGKLPHEVTVVANIPLVHTHVHAGDYVGVVLDDVGTSRRLVLAGVKISIIREVGVGCGGLYLLTNTGIVLHSI